MPQSVDGALRPRALSSAENWRKVFGGSRLVARQLETFESERCCVRMAAAAVPPTASITSEAVKSGLESAACESFMPPKIVHES